MLQNVLKVLTFSLISLVTTQMFLQTIDLGSSPFPEIILLLMTIFLLNMFIQPVLGIVSLPNTGLKFLFIHFLMTIIFLLILMQILGNFKIVELSTDNLLFVGSMIPSNNLSSSLSLVITSFVLSLIYRYFMWLSSKK